MHSHQIFFDCVNPPFFQVQAALEAILFFWQLFTCLPLFFVGDRRMAAIGKRSWRAVASSRPETSKNSQNRKTTPGGARAGRL
jgi:hypothetical protein